MKNECDQFWGKSDLLPMDAILDYWCDNKPNECREAKKYAIIKACKDGEIHYESRAPWPAGVLELVEKDLILIRRETFDVWAACFLEEGEQAIPPIYSTKAEATLLKIIGALITIHYDKQAFKTGGKPNASAIEAAILGKLKRNDGLRDGTIRKKIPVAMDAIKENLSTW